MNSDVFKAIAKYIIRPIVICISMIIIISIIANKAHDIAMPNQSSNNTIYTNYTRVIEIVVTNTVFGDNPWVIQK